ncbi:hypothetical protein LV164_001993 [Aspergillus fumigatus]|nr:hypothetical protein KXX42_001044 [Aspergillus fumigatus]KAH1554543.1 hypothetical protein KXX57_005371 [Aspergillus fumigatus]KAH2767169.1 hypothetical protein KXV94_002090 [Aspergillus fumigatus]KAH3198645.1 hypothetical protein KXV92_000367 [Aspergillus fumigatus]KAH3200221.1 hypothetical protein KXW62_000411 [Aspergillus fumigatus]
MFAIQASQKQSSAADNEKWMENCIPNILPCRIHHDGFVESLEHYWNPVSDEKDERLQTAYFRGRRLRGRRVAIPEGYQGIVVQHTERILPPKRRATGDETENQMEQEGPVKVLEQQATFDEFVVWGHEELPAADDAFVKGVEEWLKMAAASATQRHVSLEISMRFEVNHWFVTTYPGLGGRLSLSDLLLRPWPLAGAMSDTGNIVRGNTNR